MIINYCHSLSIRSEGNLHTKRFAKRVSSFNPHDIDEIGVAILILERRKPRLREVH